MKKMDLLMRQPVEINDKIEFGLFAKQKIKKGEVILELKGEIFQHPIQSSIQLEPNKHMVDDVARNINHHCHPNAKVYQNTIISIRDISEREEITLDYNETEDHIAFPFTCHCCGKRIIGKLSKL